MLPGLSEELFEAAIRKITENQALLSERGWLVLLSSYPTFRLAIRHRKTGKLRVFEFTCNEWNDSPVKLSIVDGETLEPLLGCRWPRDNSGRWHSTGWISGSNISTTLPFMCMVGIAEYHTHYSHTVDSWSKYRDLPDYTLENIVAQVAEAFQKADV